MAEDDTDRATTTRIRQLEKLDGLAKTFGRSLSTALSGSLGSGRQLDSLLGSLGGKLAGAAVKAALKPKTCGPGPRTWAMAPPLSEQRPAKAAPPATNST